MSNHSDWHLANIWESVADAVPDASAVRYKDIQLTWRSYDDRAARLAQVFTDAGLAVGAKVAIYSRNRNEYLEAQYAAFKARAVPINVNYRYLETELAHVIIDSDSEVVVFEAEFAPRLKAIRNQLSMVKLFLEIDDNSGEHLDGALPYDEAIASSDPMPRIARSGEDIYMLYTGGTTGLPKGVMYDHHTFTSALIGKAMQLRQLEVPASAKLLGPIVKSIRAAGKSPCSLPACPLMHGTGMWIGVVIPHALGGEVVLVENRKFDAVELLKTMEASGVRETVIVGDAFANPISAALTAAKEHAEPFDLSKLRVVQSSGVMFSSQAKSALLEHLDVIIFDSMGSTEGSMGFSVSSRQSIHQDKTGKFQPSPTTRIFTEDGRAVKPGSGEAGLICNGGMVPLGYYKDKKKSATTFRTIAGVRYSVPGDYARLEADGTITLLGRGSNCINSGGEKIYPEEVEETVKTHVAVIDCLVVGVPDPKFGEAVAAVFSTHGDCDVSGEELKAHVRGLLADYKAPRHFIGVDVVPRAVNGKADYKQTKKIALTALNP